MRFLTGAAIAALWLTAGCDSDQGQRQRGDDSRTELRPEEQARQQPGQARGDAIVGGKVGPDGKVVEL